MRFVVVGICLSILLAIAFDRPIVAPAVEAKGCPVSTPTSELAPTPGPADGYDPFPGGTRWYHSADRQIWAQDQLWLAKRWIKVPWLKPSGSTLIVSGRRLDGSAPPLRARLPCCYSGHFQASGLLFPARGCWVVRARAARSALRFVVRVPPAGSRRLRGSL